MSSKPYNIGFRTQFISYEDYILATSILKSTYPFKREMEIRAIIFSEGLKQIIKNNESQNAKGRL